MKFKTIYPIVYYILIYSSSFCQFEPLKKDILLTDVFNREYPREKIFIHYDRPYYNVNDTLWLKGYIVSAKNCVAADSSRISYIEILNSSGEVVKRVSTYCSTGIFYSNIWLNNADFKQGTYLLRAYTNYMRNYGESLFFESSFKIINPDSNEWGLSIDSIRLLNKRFVLSATLQPLLRKSTQQQNISVILRSKNHIIFRQQNAINKNGNISIDTLLTKEVTGDILHLEGSNDDHLKIQLPVYVDEEQQTDLQFLPEGGTFIANKLTLLGFKAVNIFGKGMDVKGKIVNSKRQLVATFSSLHNGMGTVWLQPEVGERYIAVLDNGLSFPLPIPRQSGTQLQIINHPGSDSVAIIVDATPDLYYKKYFFRASAKGISCAMGIIRIKDKPYRLSISKKAFPSGICRFTLYDSDYLPVNERIILVWNNDILKLNLAAQKSFYGNRDSVHLLLTAKNVNNEPTAGSFSVAVIDTGGPQYSKYPENIISYLLLTSDIKGKIEDPSYYFDSPLPEATEALMLTQGWVQYNHLFSKPAFEYEKEFAITGKVVNLFNKSVSNANMTLFGKDGKANTFISDTETDKNGNFTFKGFPSFVTENVNMLIKALNKKGRPFGVNVEVDLPVFPGFNTTGQPALKEDIMYDAKATHYVQQQAKLYNRLMKNEKGYLPEVIVNSRIKIKGSKNLNADGGADQIITPKILETKPKDNLLDVLTKKVVEFHRGPFPGSSLLTYKVNGNIIVFIIDGYNINKAYEPFSESFTAFAEYEEDYLKYIKAEDVAGVEIMNTSKNTFAYEKYYNLTSNGSVEYTFIEITTHLGNGAFDKKVPGMYLYKPLAPVISKTYYSPRYSTARKNSTLPDYRSTLYWKPDIFTNEKGEAEFSFYTSDSNSGYVVIVQGTDLKGGLGTVYLPLIVKKEDKTVTK